MKLCFEVPDTFEACGITIVYEAGVRGQAIYSASITRDEVGGEKVLELPRKGDNRHESE